MNVSELVWLDGDTKFEYELIYCMTDKTQRIPSYAGNLARVLAH
jgi:hypothetical protein